MIGTAPALSACFATTLLLLVLVGTPCQGMGSWSVSVSISHLWLVWPSGDGGREQWGWSICGIWGDGRMTRVLVELCIAGVCKP